MRKVELLRQVQDLDLALERCHARIEALNQQLADRTELDEATAQQEREQRELRRLETDQTDLELDVEDLRGKLKELDGKLYSGSVRNPKELDGLAKEAELLRRNISTREDRLLESFDHVERTSAALATASRRQADADSEWRARQQALSAELRQAQAEAERLDQERLRIRNLLDPQALRSYDGLRRARGGLAVVEVRQRTCQGCRISLPVTEELRARSSQDLVFCQSCGRILHATL